MINQNKSPLEVLTQYTGCFEDADETKSKLDLLLDTAMSCTDADDWSADERANLIFCCRQTQLLLTTILAGEITVLSFVKSDVSHRTL